jgi:hypothetical protein
MSSFQCCIVFSLMTQSQRFLLPFCVDDIEVIHYNNQTATRNHMNAVIQDRLRTQGLIQRLRREHGDDTAWEILCEAMETELRVPDHNRGQKKPVLPPAHK